jgi:hypothetical protein
MGHVYLLMAIDDAGKEKFKIGVTKRDINLRIKELQTGNSSKISLLKSYTSENYIKVETWLHRKYQIKTEAKNEWRTLTDEQVFSFLEDCKKADETISFLLKENPFYK